MQVSGEGRSFSTTIETIDNTLCTIIRRPFDAEAVRESLAMGVPVVAETSKKLEVVIIQWCDDGSVFYEDDLSIRDCSISEMEFTHTLTMLPSLSPFPADEEVFAYEAQGIRIFRSSPKGTTHRAIFGTHRDCPVTHGIAAHDGQRAEIAIKEETESLTSSGEV